MLIQDRSMPAREETSYGFIASTARHASFSCSTTLRSPIANATHQNHFLLRATSNLIDTHVARVQYNGGVHTAKIGEHLPAAHLAFSGTEVLVDVNLGATERQMSGRKMLPDLGGVHPTVVLHSRDVSINQIRCRAKQEVILMRCVGYRTTKCCATTKRSMPRCACDKPITCLFSC